MRINTNVAALNSYNQLKNTQNNLSKSLSRLSSGKRINGAADDAAGLAISEKMGSQTRGLAQAQRNAQDGISMIQTAEGALKESHSILQRMRELSVQSANDTNTEADRLEIQKEVDQLSAELTRIGNTTEFNTQNLLDGTLDDTKFQIGANEGQNMTVSINDMRADELGVAEASGVFEDIESTATADMGTDTVISDGDKLAVEELNETQDVDTVTDAKYLLKNENNEIVGASADGTNYTLVSSGNGTAAENVEDVVFGDDGAATSAELTWDASTGGNFNKITSGTIEVETASSGTISATNTLTEDVDGLGSGTYEVVDPANRNDSDHTGDTVLVNNNDEIVGYEDGSTGNYQDAQGNALFSDTGTYLAAGDTIEIGGDGGIDVSTQDAANSAISTLDDAIANVSAERSKLGAVQNRLDHTINNLNTAEENLTAAESRISDVDMAKEMMNMSKQQILSQAGTAMMAQANQLPQGVLQLLG